MGSRQREERVDKAIQKPLSETEKLEKLESSGCSPLQADDNHQLHLLYTLLSDLESLKQDGMNMQPKALSEEYREVSIIKAGEQESEKNLKPSDKDGKDGHGPCRSNDVAEAGEIVEELPEVKRQNIVTQCLVSFFVVLTVTFQPSEVSLIM